MLKKFKLGTKLMIGFLITAVISTFIGVTGVIVITSLNTKFNDLHDYSGKAIECLYKVSKANSEVKSNERTLLISNLDKEVVQRQFRERDEYIDIIQKAFVEYESLNHSSEERGKWEVFKKLWQDWKSTDDLFIKNADLFHNSNQNNLNEEMRNATLNTGSKKFKAAEAELNKIIENKLIRGDEEHELSKKEARSYINLIVIGIIAGFIVPIIIGIFMVRMILTSIKSIKGSLLDIIKGEGDLTIKIPVMSKDEIGETAENFNKFIEKLNYIIQDIGESSEKVASSAVELSAGMKNVAEGSQNQAKEILDIESKSGVLRTKMENIMDNVRNQSAAVEETSSSLEELSQTISQVAKNTESTTKLSESSLSFAVEGGAFVKRSIEGMKTIEKIVGNVEKSVTSLGGKVKNIEDKNIKLGNTVKRIEEKNINLGTAVKRIEDKNVKLGESSQKIGEILKVIETISEHTNLLALNAAIEAAHAGDAGRGFAVVADEIKGLAERAKKSTKEIENIIKTIQNDVKNVIVETQESYREVENVIEETRLGYKEVESVIRDTKDGSTDAQKVIEETTTGYTEVRRGMELSVETGNKIEDIIKFVEKTAVEIKNVSIAMEEQANGINEMTKAVGNIAAGSSNVEELAMDQIEILMGILQAVEAMSTVAQTTAAETQEALASSDELSEISENLNGLVGQFKTQKNECKGIDNIKGNK